MKKTVLKFIFLGFFCFIYVTNVSALTLSKTIKNGDYIRYIPNSVDYILDQNLTGNDMSQNIQDSIDPSELTLWRVININDDGAIEAISTGVTSKKISFSGIDGYRNFVGVLNSIARQYETEGVTIGSRCFGYNGQTEYINDMTYLLKTTPPGETTSSDTSDLMEKRGLGDIYYEKDEKLVKNVFGTLNCYNDVGEKMDYWYASRYYQKFWGDNDWKFYGRSTDSNKNNLLYYYSYNFSKMVNSHYFRPIIIFDPSLNVEGIGTVDNPYEIVKYYNINKNVSSNGTYNVSKNKAMQGENIQITLNPDNGYELDKIIVQNEKTNDYINVVNNNFIMPDSNVFVTVIFKKIINSSNLYNIKKNVSVNGIYNISKNKAMQGENIQITLNPDDGYELDKIIVQNEKTNDYINVVNNNFIMPDSNVIITVIFKKKNNYQVLSNNDRNFKIIKENFTNLPQTGDNIDLFCSLFIISSIGILLLILYFKKICFMGVE